MKKEARRHRGGLLLFREPDMGKHPGIKRFNQASGLAFTMSSRHGSAKYVFRSPRRESLKFMLETTMKKTTVVALLACATTLSACYSSGPRPLPVVNNQAPTVEGAWSDPNGIISTFQGGTFATRTTDTNQLLASGTYTSVSDRLVEINMTSHVRNTQSKVNCALVTPTQLNCTSDSGGQFSLTRRS